MSDDEYYANSLYDEDDDQPWDDGAEGDIAGDLAEHTLHSPVWQDDPGYELQQGFSDWDYYSDDYYDDDPALLKQNPQEGSPLMGSRKLGRESGGRVKRGKKRKYVETEDITSLKLNDRRTLDQCIKGTVWAEKMPVIDTAYRDGESGKVALLKEWREVFKTADTREGKSRSTFGRGQLHCDESWANDMSLEDMGLATAKRGSTTGTANIEDEAQQDEEDEELELLDEEQELADIGAFELQENGDGEYLVDQRPVNKPRKRQKMNGTMPPSQTKRETQPGDGIDDKAPLDTPLSQNRGATRRDQDQEEGPAKSMSPPQESMTEAPPRDSVFSRKRRVSLSDDDRGESAQKSNIANRAKRVASSKLSTKPSTAEDVPHLPTKKMPRSRKNG